MLRGLDLSHHNFNMKSYNLSGYDFVILKATEGKSFVDNRIKFWTRVLDQNEIDLRGFYHFARPEIGNSAYEEAHNFISHIEPYLNTESHYLLALDVEAGALKYANLDKWVEEWCQIVEIETGIKPLIYCSAAECKKFKSAQNMGCGLWVAKWSDRAPTKTQIKPFEFWAVWQYTDNERVNNVRCDCNYFNGTREQYMKYCEVANGKSNDTNETRD